MALDWPPLMPTKMAARYCGYDSVFGLHKAHERGKVFPAGRRGGTGAYMWRREDLDRFLCGEPPTNAPPSRPRARRALAGSVDAALAQLRAFMAERKPEKGE